MTDARVVRKKSTFAKGFMFEGVMNSSESNFCLQKDSVRLVIVQRIKDRQKPTNKILLTEGDGFLPLLPNFNQIEGLLSHRCRLASKKYKGLKIHSHEMVANLQ